nr:enamelin [Oryctolagus cuniculus]
MLLLWYRNGASFPELDNLVPSGKMKILLTFLGLLGNAMAMPMHMPRMPGFSSKSEEMMRYGPFPFMNYPHMSPMGPYGNGFQFPQQFPPYQMPMWPQPPPNMWLPPKPAGFRRQSNTDQAQETQKPNETQTKTEQQPVNQPPTPTPAKEETPPTQTFPPFNNGLFPYQQPPWPFPQRMPPPGYGRLSNEEGGNPYFGFFGYHGFGGRPPYYSEEMYDDIEKPKEEDPPKAESPATETSANATVNETNSTQPNAGGSQGGNDTSPVGNGAPGQNTGSNPTAQNGVNPSPAVNTSGQGAPRSQFPWRPSQPNIYENYPNHNTRNFPSERQWHHTGTAVGHRPNGPFYRNQQVQRGTQWNSFAWESKQATRPENPTYRKTFHSTTRGYYTNYAGNPANFRRRPQGPNKNVIGTNVASLGPKQGSVGHNEKVQNPKEKSIGQKERTVVPTKDTTGPWKNSQSYGVNKRYYKLPWSEGNIQGPNFNSIGQQENSYNPRGDSRRIPNSGVQIQSQNLPKGIVLQPKRTPYEPQTNQPELKHRTYQPAYPKEIPTSTREHFPTGRNTWNHQEISPRFKEDPRWQAKRLPPSPPPSHGSRGSVFFQKYSPYDPRENPPYRRSNMWGEIVDPPSTMRQPENPKYPMNTPDQKETYNEEDPIDPTGDEIFPGQSTWGEEELSFKRDPTVRQYGGGQYALNQPKEIFPYPADNPSKPKEDFPYNDFYPWSPDENFPSYNTGPTVTPPMQNKGYYTTSAAEQEESTLFPSWNSWDYSFQAQEEKEKQPYYNRNYWDQATNLQQTPASIPDLKETQLYYTSSPAGLQKNPVWHEDENLNYGMQITSLNSPDRDYLTYSDLITQNYPSSQKEIHLYHQSQRGPCCTGGSTGPKDNPLSLQAYTSSYGLAPEEKQDTNPLYTESSHTNNPSPIVSPTSILPGQRNSSENRLPGEIQSPISFRDDVSTLRRNIPCSMKNQLSQLEIMSNSPQSKNTPCLKNDLGGDGNNIVKQMFEGNQLNERTVALTPEQLIMGTPDEGPRPKGIQSEVQGNESEKQQQRPPRILHVPCFGSKLADHHSVSTGTPSTSGKQDPTDGDLIMPTGNPGTSVGLATGEQFKHINVNSFNANEHTPYESFQTGTNPQDQVQDCLLLQV